ncbi:MAG: HEAT repeat domain-containing protein, partial [Myxococcales bacterium]|nr:HEAT repeat domain-containing protein [Myxococcales bacterium]
WVATAVLAITGLACGGVFGPGSIALTHELSGTEAEAARALGSELVDGRFPEAIASDCAAHARQWPWLAARAKDPALRVAALHAAATCPQELDRVDAVAVASGVLADPDPRVAGGGLALASALLPDEPEGSGLARAVAHLAQEGSGPARYDALRVLDRTTWTQDPTLSAPFTAALDAEDPYVVSEALRLIRYRTAGLSDPSAFREAAMARTSDIDPGIRGRAALLLARLAPEDPAVRARLIELAADPHGYTRAAAAEALGELEWPSASHVLIGLVDDHAKAVWDMNPFERLDGSTEVLHHSGSSFERVDDAALRALQRATASLGDEAYAYREVSLRYLDLDIIAAGRDAKRWYEAHAEAIPRP